MRYQLTIAYDGTSYSGWQVQKNSLAIQPLIQKALITVLRHPLDLTGSGRTDAGVHAKGQTAHFDSEISFDPKRLILSLNALLPVDIRILSIDPREASFHARYSAVAKIYHYHLHLNQLQDPFTFPYCWRINLNAAEQARLKESCKLFLGTRDFTSFANEAHRGTASYDPVRTLSRFDFLEEPGGARLELEANGFLYKMVRNLVGTAIAIAQEKILPSQLESIFLAKDRRRAGPAAPPQGLFLVKVLY